MPERPVCIIDVGHSDADYLASWLMNGDPDRPICDHHKGQYETAYDDYSDIVWVPIEDEDDEPVPPWRTSLTGAEPGGFYGPPPPGLMYRR